MIFQLLFIFCLLLAPLAHAQGLSLADPAFVGNLTAPASGGAYVASATTLDGTNDHLSRSGALNGASDGKKGSASFWLNLKGANSSLQYVFTLDTYFFRIIRDVGDNLQVFGFTTGSVKILDIITTSGNFTTSMGWVHVLMCWDMATAGARHIYTNGVETTITENTFTNDTIDYTGAETLIGRHPASGYRLNACLSEVWINLSEYVNDPTKFRDATTGEPLSLGATGSVPTGTAPTIYLPNAYDTFQTDASGNANNFTVTGALTACSDAP